MDCRILIHLEKRKQHRQEVRHAVKRWFSVVSVVLVLYLSLSESVGQSHFWKQLDKGMHFLLFGIFSFLFIQFAQQNLFLRCTSPVRCLIITLVLFVACFFGEAIHLIVPGRTFEWGDMVANFLGSSSFGLIATFLFPPKDLSAVHGVTPLEKQSNTFQGNKPIKRRRRRNKHRIHPK